MHLFIFGEQRTGTTLLQRLLGAHPDIETTPNDFNLMRLPRGKYDMQQMKKLMEWKLDDFWKVREKKNFMLIRLAILSHFRKRKCVVKLHKTPKGELDLKLYKSAFPYTSRRLSGRFIYMVRNPFAVCASRKHWNNVGAAWVSMDENIRFQQLADTSTYVKQHLHRLFRSLRIIDAESAVASTVDVVVYEDLVTGPIPILQGVLNKLKVSSRKETVSKMLKSTGSPYTSYQELESKADVYTESIDLWKKKLTRFEISVILNELKDFLDSYTFRNPELQVLFAIYLAQGHHAKRIS